VLGVELEGVLMGYRVWVWFNLVCVVGSLQMGLGFMGFGVWNGMGVVGCGLRMGDVGCGM